MVSILYREHQNLMFLGEKNWAIRYAPATNNINALAEKSAEAFLRLEANRKQVVLVGFKGLRSQSRLLGTVVSPSSRW